ncbi:hypothetical protein Q7P37_007852 [Cladosporium fusiforme]
MQNLYGSINATGGSAEQSLTRMPGITSLNTTSYFTRKRPFVSTEQIGSGCSSQEQVSPYVSQQRSVIIASEAPCRFSYHEEKATLSKACDQQACDILSCQLGENTADSPADKCDEQTSVDKKLLQQVSPAELSSRSQLPASIVAEPIYTPLQSLRSERTSDSERSYIRGPESVTFHRERRGTSSGNNVTTSRIPTNSSIQQTPSNIIGKHPQFTDQTDIPKAHESDESSPDSSLRKHVVIRGQLMPVFGARVEDKTLTNESANSPSFLDSSTTTIAVGARPLLQTCQGFPFDLRSSRPEASRLMNLSMDNGADLSDGRPTFRERLQKLLGSLARRLDERR